MVVCEVRIDEYVNYILPRIKRLILRDKCVTSMEIVPIICTVLCDVYVEILEYPGKAKSPIMRYLTESVSHLCIPYSANVAYDGSDMYLPKYLLYG